MLKRLSAWITSSNSFMDLQHIIQELDRNKMIFNSLFENVERQIYLWKPAPEKWCLLEILCHLYDEEREDFRARVKHTLENCQQPMSPIDPAGWVTGRKYIEQNYSDVLKKFLSERQLSVDWLGQLKTPEWSNSYIHPQLGAMTAEIFLSNWLAHDYLHIRQITRTKYLYLENISKQDLSYAGKW